MGNVRVKVHNAYRKVVAVSDPELLGKKFVKDDFQIDVSREFYGGDVMDEGKALEIIKIENADDSTFLFVGKNSVDAGIKAGIISNSKKSIIRIQGVPHALALL